MDKAELIKRLAGTTGVDERMVRQVTDSLIAELVTPQLFGTGAKPGIFADNNCGNGCGGAAREAASGQPG